MSFEKLCKDLEAGNRTALAKAITLMESTRPADWDEAKKLLKHFKDKEVVTRRLGFSGPPGVGKSTFIEKMGLLLTNKGQRVAVLAIDPSSEISGGSILGDKTRMELLSRSEKAFVRPSATRGHLGGVTSRLPGVIRLCEIAGYEWILVESVGVGQSEIELSRMVDLFTLLSQAGAGDELQGIKKGILEYVDMIVVNKNDRDPQQVNITRQQYLAALKIVRQKPVEIFGCSGLTGQGLDDVLQHFEEFFKSFDYGNRKMMSEFWYQSLLSSEFRQKLLADPQMSSLFQKYQSEVHHGSLMPIEAVEAFFRDLGWSKSKT